mgnify:CR=1 FL=1
MDVMALQLLYLSTYVIFYNPTEMTHPGGITNLDVVYVIMW